jgi:hypothetical protein
MSQSTPDVALSDRARILKALVERVGGVLLQRKPGWTVVIATPGRRRCMYCRNLDELEQVATGMVWGRLDVDGKVRR